VIGRRLHCAWNVFMNWPCSLQSPPDCSASLRRRLRLAAAPPRCENCRLQPVRPSVISSRVKWLRIATAALLLALWVPVTSHCLLEEAGFIEPDECCEPFGASSSDTHDCGGHCQTVESIGFNLPRPQTAPTPPTAVLAALAVPGLFLNLQPAPAAEPAPNPSPPELLHAWQFLTRAVPPVRAPSRIA